MKDVRTYSMKRYTGLTNGQTGQQLSGLSDFTVAKVYQRFLEKLRTDVSLAKRVEEMGKKMSNVKCLLMGDPDHSSTPIILPVL
jgi:hypothetical protein